MAVKDAQAVELRGRVYVGGGVTDSPWVSGDRYVHVYDTATNTWTDVLSPVKFAALVVYEAQLVLAGGQEMATGRPTNELWALSEETRLWSQPLPPFSVPRFAASAVSHDRHLVVVGGWDGDTVFDAVEVYARDHWIRTAPLPIAQYRMKMTMLDGTWFLMGGLASFTTPSEETVSVNIQTLLDDVNVPVDKGAVNDNRSHWEVLSTRAPFFCSSVSSMLGNLVALGGRNRANELSSCILQLGGGGEWRKIASLPETMHISSCCALKLSTKEEVVMVIGGEVDAIHGGTSCSKRVLRITVKK